MERKFQFLFVCRYKTDDLRITVVYRAKCFENEQKRDAYNQWYQTATPHQVQHVNEIVDELKDELAKRRGIDRKGLDELEVVDLAAAFIEEFISYPLPAKAIMPYNYCILIKTHPITEPFLRYLC